MLFCKLAFLPSLLSFAAGSAIPLQAEPQIKKGPAIPLRVEPPTKRTTCTNSPTDRGCWSDGYSIDTDSETSWPDTGVTNYYTLVISEQKASPDGTEKDMLLINGTFPGPTLVANWGDWLEITVVNAMTGNGTSMHWHGITQYNTNIYDGVNGVTECPVQPGGSRTYRWQAVEYGSSWYHSHYSFQYGDGVVGAIQINGPASANYDVDLGPFTITDYFYDSTYIEFEKDNAGGGPPVPNNGLINGTMRNVDDTAGSYNTVTMEKGKRYLLRLINPSIDTWWALSLDNHVMEIVQADFVATKPYNTSSIFIGIGQRYDVIITADQEPGNYWFRAEVGNCGASIGNNNTIGAIFNYEDVAVATPNSTATALPAVCSDEPMVPYVVKAVPQPDFDQQTIAADKLNISNGKNPVTGIGSWYINDVPVNISWETPTLEMVNKGSTSFPTSYNVYETPDPNVWVYWVIQNLGEVPHPIHLHGHDFSVLGQAENVTFTSDLVDTLNFANPTRRDVAMLLPTGYLVLAWLTDNPGAWLLHCHIVWHIGVGLGLQFLERASEIKDVMDLDIVQPACDAFDSWYANTPDKKLDSGL